MAEANESTPLMQYSSMPGASLGSEDDFLKICSPGGVKSLSYGHTYGMGKRAQRGGKLKLARGTGRRVIPVVECPNDPLKGKRKRMPYEHLRSEIEQNPEAQIIREANAVPAGTKTETERLRMKYYDKCREYVLRNAREWDNLIRIEHENAGVREAIIEEEADHDDYFPLELPDHLVAPQFFVLNIPFMSKRAGKQKSIITILSLWNTMMGTSLLNVPWALGKAGFAMGLFISVGMAFIAAYTGILILKCHVSLVRKLQCHVPEFAQVCGHLFGRRCALVASLASLAAVGGAAIVFWVLMSNFLYDTVTYIYDSATGSSHTPANNSGGVYCPSNPDEGDGWTGFMANNDSGNGTSTDFDTFWNMSTTPLFLFALLPLISMRSVTFFTKFNSLGTGTVVFLIGVVIYYASQWGINVDFSEVSSPSFVPMYQSTFCTLSGMLSLGLFIHNAVITIMSNNEVQENNNRDLTIAFCLVTGTYMVIGILFYLSFPLDKKCIEDNLLNNFHLNDPIMVACRALLLFQLITVFPLIMYILRNQFFLMILPDGTDEKTWHIWLLNVVTVAICALVAIFYPSIGTIIRYTGAICGFTLIFFLPCLAYLKLQQMEARMSLGTCVLHAAIIMVGLANIAAQFTV